MLISPDIVAMIRFYLVPKARLALKQKQNNYEINTKNYETILNRIKSLKTEKRHINVSLTRSTREVTKAQHLKTEMEALFTLNRYSSNIEKSNLENNFMVQVNGASKEFSKYLSDGSFEDSLSTLNAFQSKLSSLIHVHQNITHRQREMVAELKCSKARLASASETLAKKKREKSALQNRHDAIDLQIRQQKIKMGHAESLLPNKGTKASSIKRVYTYDADKQGTIKRQMKRRRLTAV